MYGVSDGEYAGKCLCYDCTAGLVQANIDAVAEFKEDTKKSLIKTGIGAAIGGLIGAAMGGIVGFIVGVGLGGSANLALRALGQFVKGAFNAASGDASGLFRALGTCIGAPFATIKKIASISWQMKKAQDILASDSAALEAMRDYFAYTLAMEQSEDTKSFDTLTAEGGELFGNSYANRVKANGEKAAQAELRKSVVQIAANGEIIRSFDPLKKPGKAA